MAGAHEGQGRGILAWASGIVPLRSGAAVEPILTSAVQLPVQLRHVRFFEGLEVRILRVNAYLAAGLSVPAEMQMDGSFVRPLRRGGRDRERILTVGKRKPVAESPVRPQSNLTVTDFRLGVRFGGAIEHEFGIDVQPEVALTSARLLDAEWACN